MTKKKTNYALWTVICLVSILAVGTVSVIAFSNNSTVPPTTVIENAGGVTINNPAQPVLEEAPLGAVTSADALPAMVCSSDECVYTATGSFLDASTTILWFVDPFLRATSSAADVVIDGTTFSGIGQTGATSTVDFLMLNITGVATSSFSMSCGASVGPGTADTLSLMDTTGVVGAGIATGTTGILLNKLTLALGGAGDVGTVESVTLGGKYPYFNCIVDAPTAEEAFLNTANTFDGKWAAHIRRTR